MLDGIVFRVTYRRQPLTRPAQPWDATFTPLAFGALRALFALRPRRADRPRFPLRSLLAAWAHSADCHVDVAVPPCRRTLISSGHRQQKRARSGGCERGQHGNDACGGLADDGERKARKRYGGRRITKVFAADRDQLRHQINGDFRDHQLRRDFSGSCRRL
jgi:hypothetical protein